jgi:hypothetical protein
LRHWHRSARGDLEQLRCVPGGQVREHRRHVAPRAVPQKPLHRRCPLCAVHLLRHGHLRGRARLSACKACHGTKTTFNIASESAGACVCGKGTYQAAPNSSASATCPVGSSTDEIAAPSADYCLCELAPLAQGCFGLRALPPHDSAPSRQQRGQLPTPWRRVPHGVQQSPKLLKRFWSAPDDPLAAFECESEARCVGGDPGVGECGAGLKGQRCSHCKEGTLWKLRVH